MIDNEIRYISYEEVLDVYNRTIEKSGGGFSGIRDEGSIKAVIEFIQNDMYYPDFVSKLSHLVFRFCSGHFFNDGNKRIALTLGTYFLHKNGHNWAAVTFMKRMEAIVYHIAAGNISDELLLPLANLCLRRIYDDSVMKGDIAYSISLMTGVSSL
jgi:death-on-curing protein